MTDVKAHPINHLATRLASRRLNEPAEFSKGWRVAGNYGFKSDSPKI